MMIVDWALGDRLASALERIGIGKGTVRHLEDWIGVPCGCEERQIKLNQLGFWTERVLSGRITEAKKYLSLIIGEGATK